MNTPPFAQESFVLVPRDMICAFQVCVSAYTFECLNSTISNRMIGNALHSLYSGKDAAYLSCIRTDLDWHFGYGYGLANTATQITLCQARE